MEENKKENKLNSILSEKNKPYLFIIGMSIILILYYLVPMYKTIVKNDTAFISGFASLLYIRDSADSLYYASLFNIVGILLPAIVVIVSLTGIFGDDKRKIITKFVLFVLLLLKIISDILVLVFSYQTKTNVQVSIALNIQVGLSVIVFIFYILFFFFLKTKDNK